MDVELNGPPTATGVTSFTPSSASSQRIGLWEPDQIAKADEANHVSGRILWTSSANAAAYVLTTPGFTPADTWTITYQGYLPDFSASRVAELQPIAGTDTYRVALQAHSPGSTRVTQFTNVYDGSHGVRVGDIVEFWTGPTPPDPDEPSQPICPDTTVIQGDGLPTPPIEGKVLSVDPPDDAHQGGSLVVARGDCVAILKSGSTAPDCATHGPWTERKNCWGTLAKLLPVAGSSDLGALPVRIRAGGGTAGAEEFVVAGAATGYAGRAVAGTFTGPVADATFKFTSENEAALTAQLQTCTSDCRALEEQLAIARRARRTHLPSVTCVRSSSSQPRTYCETYFPSFVSTAADGSLLPAFPVPKGPTLAFSIGLTCITGAAGCPAGQGVKRALVRDTQAAFVTRSGWTPSARYGGGANGGPPTQPTGLAAFDRSNPEWGKQEDRYRFFVTYVDNLVLDVTAAQTNGDTRVLR